MGLGGVYIYIYKTHSWWICEVSHKTKSENTVKAKSNVFVTSQETASIYAVWGGHEAGQLYLGIARVTLVLTRLKSLLEFKPVWISQLRKAEEDPRSAKN